MRPLRTPAALALLIACGAPGHVTLLDAPVPVPDLRCRIENVVARLAAPDSTSCNAALDEAQRRAAHDCIVAALQAQMPFQAIYEREGIDSRLARGYVGRAPMFFVVDYDGDPGGGGGEDNPVSRISTCDALIDLGACDSQELGASLCLQCTAPVIVEDCR